MKSLGDRVLHLNDRWLLAIMLAYSLLVVGWLLLSGINVTNEDGYYYFKIAQHLAQGNGSTFDGVNPTNGYHPFWLLLLVPIFWLTVDTETALLLGNLLQAALILLGVTLAFLSARLVFGQLASILVVLLWLGSTDHVYLSGLEFSLHAALMLLVVYMFLRWFYWEPPERFQPYLLLGFALALLMLARLDTILLAGIIGLWLLWREIGRGWTRQSVLRLFWLSAPLVLAIGAYVVVNQRLFGHLLPVSMAVKRESSAYLLRMDPTYVALGLLPAKLKNLSAPFLDISNQRPLVIGTFGIGSLWLIATFFETRSSHMKVLADNIRPWSVFIIYSWVSYLSYALLHHGLMSFAPWYFVIQRWLAAVAIAAVVVWIEQWFTQIVKLRQSRWPRASTYAGYVVLIVLVVLASAIDQFKWRAQEQSDEKPTTLGKSALWARQNLPADAIIGSWNAGIIGFKSERQVVNLDGLVNSWGFFENDRHDLCQYWDNMGIRYLVDAFEGKRALALLPTLPAYQHCTDRLELLWNDSSYNQPWEMRAYRIAPPNEN